LDEDRIGSSYSRHLLTISAIRAAANLKNGLNAQECPLFLQVPTALHHPVASL
jgi:hypothetical protein